MRKLGLLLTLLLSFVIVDKASALGFTDVNGTYYPNGGRVYMQRHDAPGDIQGFMSGNDVVFDVRQYLSSNNLQAADVTEITWGLNRSIPANSIISFSVSFQEISLGSEYYGLDLRGAVLLSDSCKNNEPYVYINEQHRGFSCSYTAFIKDSINSLSTLEKTRIVRASLMSSYSSNPTYNIIVSGGAFRQLTNDSLSASDREWLESVLPDSTTVGEVEQAIDNAKESEKEEYEEQQEDVDAGAEEAGEEAEEATSNLIDTASTIIGAIRDTPATNCNIRIQRGGFDTGNINLCNVPQSIRTMVGAVITIPITIAALHIVYSFLYTYLVFVRKEQD